MDLNEDIEPYFGKRAKPLQQMKGKFFIDFTENSETSNSRNLSKTNKKNISSSKPSVKDPIS